MRQVKDRRSAAPGVQAPGHEEEGRSFRVGDAIVLGIAVIVVLGIVAWYTDVFAGDEGQPQPPEVVAPVADGTHFAMVTVGTDESGETTLGIDLAEMLGGEEARVAAVEDGVIGEGEDLPNDYYIRNNEVVYELMHLSETASLAVVSAVDVGSNMAITPDHLLAVYSGAEVDDTIYGIVAGQPIAMNLTVFDGKIVQAEAIYLP